MPTPIFLPDAQFDAFGGATSSLIRINSQLSSAEFKGRPIVFSRINATNAGVEVMRPGSGVIKAVSWNGGWLLLKANGVVLAFNAVNGVTVGIINTPAEPVLRSDIPAGFQSDVVDIEAHANYAVAVKEDGTLVDWALESRAALFPEGSMGLPEGDGFVQVSISQLQINRHVYAIAVKSDGSLVGWGMAHLSPMAQTGPFVSVLCGVRDGRKENPWGEYYKVESYLALRADGLLLGQSQSGLGDVVPTGVSNIVSISRRLGVGGNYTGGYGSPTIFYALRDDGLVYGAEYTGQWRDRQLYAMDGAGGLFLRSDGTVSDYSGDDFLPSRLSEISRISEGAFIRRDGSIVLLSPNIIPNTNRFLNWLPKEARVSVNSIGSNDFSVVYDGSAKTVTPNYEKPLGREVISVAYSPSPATHVGTYALTYGVSDFSYKTAIADATGVLVITPGAPILNSLQTLSGAVGSFNRTPALTDASNRPATSWAATGLPSWATLNPTTGTISGTPQDTGSTTISLTATGPGGADTETVTLSVAVGPPLIVAGQSFAGKVGEAFASATLALDDALDRPATSWSANGLPAGLSLNTTTGAITGTPTAKGSFTAFFSAMGPGSGGNSSSGSVDFTIAEGAPQIGGLIGSWGEVVLPSVSWTSLAYGNGRFVCVASNTAVAAYSSDGRNWTQVALPSVQAWNSVTYGMAYSPLFGGTRTGRFVAVGGSVAAYSDDGVVWTQAALPSNRQWYIAYGTSEPGWPSTIGGDMVITSPDRYVAVAYNNSTVAHSHDGVTWTAATLPLSRQWDSVAFGNGRFVAVSANGGTFAYSGNAQTWTTGSMPALAWNGLAYGNGIFVCIASGSNVVAYGDGVTWSQATLPSSQAWSAVAYEGGVFVAVASASGVSAYSVDGINWVQSNLPANRPWGSVVGGGGRFVTVAGGHSFAALMEPRRGQVGVPFASSFLAVDTTNRPVTSWAASGLPSWATLNTTTGAITGTPTNTGSATISLTVTGPGGTSAAITETLSVVAVSDFSAEILCICEVGASLFEGIVLASPSLSGVGTATMGLVGPLSLSVGMAAVGGLSVGGSWYFYGDVLGSFVGSAVFDGKLRLLDLKRFVCGEFESISGGGKAVVFCYTTVNGRITPQPLVNVGLKFFQDRAAAEAYREEFEAPRQFDYVSAADGRSVIEGEVNVLAPCGVYNIWAVSEPPPGDVRVHFSVNLQRA